MNFNNPYFHLESERLKFRPLTEQDIPIWAEFFIDNDRLHFFDLSQDIDPLEQSTIWIQRQLNRYTSQNMGLLAVILKQQNVLIGVCGLIPRSFESGEELEIGYSFIPNYWGNGYATEAAIRMKDFARENKLSKRVISMIHPANVDSQSVAKRNGMHPAFDATYENTPVIVFASEIFES